MLMMPPAQPRNAKNFWHSRRNKRMQSPIFPAIHIPHLEQVTLPPVHRVRLTHPRGTPVADLSQTVTAALEASQKFSTLPAGATVAIAVGSRGIARISDVVALSVQWLKGRGFRPFIVPAMGSHGGARAEDQAQILRDFNIREEVVGAPIRATMEVVEYGTVAQGIACKFDREAAAADAVLVINRVKSHTSFDRPIESGLVKMVAVGLGKAEGARNVHKIGPRGLAEVLPELARLAIAKSPISYGLALVENGDKELILVEGVEPEQFFESDERLLQVAKTYLAKLPFDQLDVLIVQEIGKDISGMGMDYAVIGRTDIRGIPNPPTPFIHKIGALSVTPESHGNAQGIGMADFIPLSVTHAIDLEALYINALTASVVEKTRIPPVLPDDRAVLRACVATCWRLDEAQARLCIIRSTLHLTEILASSSLLPELEGWEGVEVLSPPLPIEFSEEGTLLTRCP
ncbi:DUF2088 domain-containing protein [candidate division KSB3 bacterium]|uniref:DUF2088 domain-containing protein n=1 Tax=candidate division KSB3 bacterium TaxID=2044937 RepID=A0A9D5JVG5_9BACT|nr:DUF2088 domain-containing protein [candidate division KSB3 bacterium]MBD3325013.1 DUF2088 domain-containing protein [candidate division KSB3 bacterium]